MLSGIAERGRRHRADQFVAVVNRLAVDGGDDVAFLHAGLFGWARPAPPLHENAFLRARHLQLARAWSVSLLA